ncbi:uncharacterized protein LOC116349806 [Contarinia nasturtii]|uniref:uncharacterized protein LOC116349806 n=1 Tax=Contarinia nasturtii TaxID=265458 RepID=UPI0012D45A53|nr:uncharacterized protein LOC116349806 [Contarinia nasturtii]
MALFYTKIFSSCLFLKLCILISYVNIINCNVLVEIAKRNTPCSNETINYFIEFVREKYGFDMIDVRCYPHLENYPQIPGDQYDIQILYSDEFSSGHYTVVFYDPNYQTVYIYDSRITVMEYEVTGQRLSIIEKRYPMAKIVPVIPKVEQYDEISSGLFAIAYATTLILGESPANYIYEMNPRHSDKAINLRKHIIKMFRTKELSEFPRCSRLDIDYISGPLTDLNHNVLEELTTPNYCLSGFTVNLFSNLVEATTDFNLLPVNFIHYPELCPIHDETKNDVQILFQLHDGVGHVHTIFYNAANKTVIVYDYETVDMSVGMHVINRRYPNHEHITFVDRKTKQVDETSCGPFAIAYATTLIMGHDPEIYDLKTYSKPNELFDHSATFRKHILKMFRANKLLPFPQ